MILFNIYDEEMKNVTKEGLISDLRSARTFGSYTSLIGQRFKDVVFLMHNVTRILTTFSAELIQNSLLTESIRDTAILRMTYRTLSRKL